MLQSSLQGSKLCSLSTALTCDFPHVPQFYGEQKGDTIFFGDKSTKKFGTYWVDNGTGD